jgi:hypothetical protein
MLRKSVPVSGAPALLWSMRSQRILVYSYCPLTTSTNEERVSARISAQMPAAGAAPNETKPAYLVCLKYRSCNADRCASQVMLSLNSRLQAHNGSSRGSKQAFGRRICTTKRSDNRGIHLIIRMAYTHRFWRIMSTN